MFKNTQFRIIGRIGSINTLDNVVHVSVASDRRAKNADGDWITETSWNSIAVFAKSLRKRLDNPATARHGNLVAVEGTIQSSTYEKDGQKQYQIALVADEFEALSFAKKRAE